MSGDGWFLDPTGDIGFTENQSGGPDWSFYQQQWDHMWDTPVSSPSSTDFNWLKAIPLIGQTFASTYNAVNNPTAPSAYQSPQGSGGYAGGDPNAGYGSPPFSASSLVDFSTPYPYLAIGGVLLLVVFMKKR